MSLLESAIKLLAGIGLFLFASYLIEESLKEISGRNFKLFLQKITKNAIGSVAGGALVTAVLQSSSIVSLMVLAFVGAGIFTLKNAIAVIIGANLGTTIDSWIIATMGFKMNIEVVAYPAIFIGSFLLMLFRNNNYIKHLALFLLGFGLLFVGLSFLKTAMETQLSNLDFSAYNKLPLLVFLGLGFLITLLVQSSSVTMVLTLTALHVGAITFLPAAALVIGSETGTTLKIVLSAIGGNATKKRVALGNVCYNLFTTVIAFACIHQLAHFITGTLHIKDMLIALVTLSTLINLIGVIIFIPLINPITAFLEKLFTDNIPSHCAYIDKSYLGNSQAVMVLFKLETGYFIYNCMIFNLKSFGLEPIKSLQNSSFAQPFEKQKHTSKTIAMHYQFLEAV